MTGGYLFADRAAGYALRAGSGTLAETWRAVEGMGHVAILAETRPGALRVVAVRGINGPWMTPDGRTIRDTARGARLHARTVRRTIAA